MKAIGEFHQQHIVWAVLLDFIAFCLAFVVLANVIASCGNYTWYPFIILTVWSWTWFSGQTDYFWVFVLGMATALAEIIGKFPDEPLKSVKTGHAVAYHVFNGAVAVFALYVLNLFTAYPTDAGGHLKNVLAAGLGAMLVMRSKLFNIKVQGEDVSFGPEQVVKIFLSFMEEAIDRIRARNRINLLKPHVELLNFSKLTQFSEYMKTMMRSSQTRTMEQEKAFLANITAINDSTNGVVTERNKAFALGFVLLNAMGENFTIEVFENMPSDLRQIAPPATATPTLIDKLLFKASSPAEATQYYMTYGTDMSGARFRERLRWSEEQFRVMPAPSNGVLSKYRIIFNKPEDARRTGCANIVPDENENVEGVVYTLSKDQIHFLDNQAPGYQRKTVSVMVDNKPLDAEVYLATTTDDTLTADPIALNDVIKGAEEHKLSSAYIAKLQKFAATQHVDESTSSI